MSRVKHLTMLIVKLVLFVVVFAMTATLTALQVYPTDGIPLAQIADAGKLQIDTKNGATATWEVVDDQLVFDITQSGENCDDIMVWFYLDEARYDASFIRWLLGNDAGDHEAYISEMENGPWQGHFSYALKGESVTTYKAGSYTVADAAQEEYVAGVVSSEANTRERTEAFSVEKGEKTMMVLMFGAEDTGALKSGKYTLEAELKLAHPEGKKLSLGYFDMIKILFRLCADALKQYGWKVFSVTNWLTLYALWVILGWFIYLWRDMRTVLGAFIAGSAAGSYLIVKDVFVNGVYTGTQEESSSGIAAGIVQAAIVWFVLTITIPLRMLWYMIRDIIYLFKEDEVLEDFSYSGNLIGSIGIHVILMGLAGVFGVAKTFGIIALIVGVIMCIIAHFLCRGKEY